MTLSLITQPPESIDLHLSEQVHDAMLASVSADDPSTGPHHNMHPSGRSVATAAVALAAALDDATAGAPTSLSTGEAAVLREWLARLRATSQSRRADESARRQIPDT